MTRAPKTRPNDDQAEPGAVVPRTLGGTDEDVPYEEQPGLDREREVDVLPKSGPPTGRERP